MLVDNAIVMLENIYRRHQSGEDPVTASVRGASEVWGALLNATIANLAVFIPILFVKEEAGQLFRDIAIAISGAVGLSMLVAVAVVPTAARRLLRPHDEAPRTPLWKKLVPGFLQRVIVGVLWLLATILLRPLDWIGGRFIDATVGTNRFIQRSLLLRLLVVGVFLFGSLGLTWYLFPKTEYLPNGNRNLIIGILLPPPGYNLDQLNSMGQIVEDTLLPYFDRDPTDAPNPALPFPACRTSSTSPATDRCSSACARSIPCRRAN